MKPLLSNNKDKWGLGKYKEHFTHKKVFFYQFFCTALDGQLKHEDTNLASSTLVHDPTQKENLGIIVQYKVDKANSKYES